MADKKGKLEGVIPAIVTPLTKNKKVNEKLFEKQIRYLNDAGVDGFFINGSTGDGVNLTTEEKINNFKIVKDIAPDKTLCLAALKPSTEQVIKEIREFEKLEPDFVVAVTPFYCTVSRESILKHFQSIAAATDIPLVLYNIPQCTQNKIDYFSLIELAKIDNISAIKDSSGDFPTFSRWLYNSEIKTNISLIQGEDLIDAPSLILGSPGIVTGLGNVYIEPYVKMLKAARESDWETVNAMQTEINKLYGIIDAVNGKVIPAIKAATHILGRGSIYSKTAGLELDKDEIKIVEDVLRELSII